MSLSWYQRKLRLASLLKSQGGEDEEGLALDRILHGQSVIGKTAKTTEIDAIRFSDKDLIVAGALEYGQFGVIYVVTCKLDGRVYVRKSIDKKFALRNCGQCSPQTERDILLQARTTNSQWAPHLLCAFQTSTHLNLVMDYAEGGNLWDVLESSPLDGRVKESDAMWWAPQLVSAIHWCHSQGFAHRDIKPHNFVMTPDAHVLLIDFGSAAPLLPPDATGAQKLLKRYCFVPCGTCDYISPEILQAHEEALVALEMSDSDASQLEDAEGYGRETDWWSLGAMLYEMVYGCAPFFAKDIRQTYLRIMDHQKYLRFNHQKAQVSAQFQDFLRQLLTHAERRLGRHDVQEITNHPVFCEVNWNDLPTQRAPSDLHLPQFTYTEPPKLDPSPAPAGHEVQADESHSQGFSQFFQFTVLSSSPGLSILRSKSSPDPPRPPEEDATASFIGFSWGPPRDAFTTQNHQDDFMDGNTLSYMDTPQPLRILSSYLTPNPKHITPRISRLPLPQSTHDRFSTPVRPSAMSMPATLRTGTVRRTGERRSVTDREAMQQLVDCVGMSARKKVLESGRKPRILTNISRHGSLTRKELRFTDDTMPIPAPELAALSDSTGPRVKVPPKPILVNRNEPAAWSGSEDTDSEGPPSPTPRPGSAMSTLSRRSGTPTVGSVRLAMMGDMTSTNMSTIIPSNRRSMNFSRSLDLTQSFRNSLLDGQAVGKQNRATDSVTFDDMEDRLVSLFGEIRGVEERLAKVATMI